MKTWKVTLPDNTSREVRATWLFINDGDLVFRSRDEARSQYSWIVLSFARDGWSVVELINDEEVTHDPK